MLRLYRGRFCLLAAFAFSLEESLAGDFRISWMQPYRFGFIPGLRFRIAMQWRMQRKAKSTKLPALIHLAPTCGKRKKERLIAPGWRCIQCEMTHDCASIRLINEGRQLSTEGAFYECKKIPGFKFFLNFRLFGNHKVIFEDDGSEHLFLEGKCWGINKNVNEKIPEIKTNKKWTWLPES